MKIKRNHRLFALAALVVLLLSLLITPTPTRAGGTEIAVVFVSGWQGLTPGKNCDTQTTFKPGADEQDVNNYKDNYFNNIAAKLQKENLGDSGGGEQDTVGLFYRFFYAHIDSSPCHTPPIDENALNLRAAIAQAKHHSTESKVIVVAHSMGGLIARAYIENPQIYRGDVSDLITIGTPHQGIEVDDQYVLALGIAQNAEVLANSQECVCDFKTAAMAAFNKRYKQNPSVNYYLIGGSTPTSSRTQIGQSMDQVFGSVPNDGIVSTASSLGMPGKAYHLTTEAAHSSMLGSTSYFNNDSKTYACIRDVILYNPHPACGSESTVSEMKMPAGASDSTCGHGALFVETGFEVVGLFFQAWVNGPTLPPPPEPSIPLFSLTTPDELGGAFLANFQANQPSAASNSFADRIYLNGYPISNVREEVSPTDGKVYLTQWFERARFELHPENQPPYNVLLGQLGTLAVQGRQNEVPFKPVDNPGGGVAWFAQTKHTLGDTSVGGKAIADFWQRSGGLQQFGFPLSQPFTEVSKDDGKSYLVQYFERQRLEYHPEKKGTRFEIQLGRLGAEQINKPVPLPTNLTPLTPANAGKITSLRTLIGFNDAVSDVQFSPDGQLIASASDDGTIRLFKSADGSLVRVLSGEGGVNNIRFSADGQTIMAADGAAIVGGSISGATEIKTWRVADGTVLRTAKLSGYIETISPDGQLIATADYDKAQVSLWHADGTMFKTLDGTAGALNVEFSPDSQRFVVSIYQQDAATNVYTYLLQLRQVADGSTLHSINLDNYTFNLSFTPDGQTVIGTQSQDQGEVVKRWRVTDGSSLPDLKDGGSYSTSLSFSPDGQMLVIGDRDGTMHVLNANDGTLLATLEEHSTEVTSITFSPDGKLLVSGSGDNTVIIWGVH